MEGPKSQFLSLTCIDISERQQLAVAAFHYGGGGVSKTGIFYENVLRVFLKLHFLSLRYSADFGRFCIYLLSIFYHELGNKSMYQKAGRRCECESAQKRSFWNGSLKTMVANETILQILPKIDMQTEQQHSWSQKILLIDPIFKYHAFFYLVYRLFSQALNISLSFKTSVFCYVKHF